MSNYAKHRSLQTYESWHWLKSGLCVQVAAWLQDALTTEHVLLTMARHVLRMHTQSESLSDTRAHCVEDSARQAHTMVASLLRMQHNHSQSVCKHLLALVPLQYLFAKLPAPLHRRTFAAALQEPRLESNAQANAQAAVSGSVTFSTSVHSAYVCMRMATSSLPWAQCEAAMQQILGQAAIVELAELRVQGGVHGVQMHRRTGSSAASDRVHVF